MYTPESFKVSDLQTMHADMEQWNFATLITPDTEGELQVTHLPLLLKRDAGQFGVLAGHMAKANGHWRAFNTSRKAWPSSMGLTPTFRHGGIAPRKPFPPGTTWWCTPSACRASCKGPKTWRLI